MSLSSGIQANNAKPLTATKGEVNGFILGKLSKPLEEKWAFTHPAVDMVNTSYGDRYNAPYGDDLVDGFRGDVEGGKMHFAGPSSAALQGWTPVNGSSSSGPWWTVEIGGYYEGTDGNFSLDENGNEYPETRPCPGSPLAASSYQR